MKVVEFGEHELVIMKHTLSEAYFLRTLFYLRLRRRWNNAFLYLIHGFVFECSTVHQSVWIEPRTQTKCVKLLDK